MMNDFDRWQAILISRDLARIFTRLVKSRRFLVFFLFCAVGSTLTNYHQLDKTANFSAQDFALKAHKQLGGAVIPSVYPEVLSSYNQAIKLDTELAQAHAGRGSLYWLRSHYLSNFQRDAASRTMAQNLKLDLSQIPELQRLALQDYQKAQILYAQQGQSFASKQVEKAIAQAQRGEKFFCVPLQQNTPWFCVDLYRE